MTESDRNDSRDAENARFGEMFGASYAAMIDAQPKPNRSNWWLADPTNDNTIITAEEPANDNQLEAA